MDPGTEIVNQPTIPVEDTPQISRNQKKKRRLKLLRQCRKAAADQGDQRAPSPALPETISNRDLPPAKRIKSSPEAPLTEVSLPEAITSAQPVERRPQLSLSSIAPPPAPAATAAAAPGDSINPRLTPIDETQEPLSSIAMPEPVHRRDMTDVARWLHANHTTFEDTGDATKGTPARILGAAGPSQPIEHSQYILMPVLATESAASAGNPEQPQAGANEHAAATSDGTCNTWKEAEEAGTAGLQLQFIAPPAAPALDMVAPVGPNGMRVYIHGNYHRYYGYRLGQAFSEDPRLALLERNWFAGRRCMDIGCNEGLVTLGIATKFGAKSMIGVDLDEHLIKRACTHLREERSAAVMRAVAARSKGVPAQERRATRTAVAALAQTWFVHGDFLESRAEDGSVDCLTALSVTKWVHLHRGDEGLRAFFAKVHSLLSRGGLFVLEPQPWRSYRAAAGKMRRQGGAELPLPSTSFFYRLQDLELRPEDFPELLSTEFGFKFLRKLQPEEAAEGFDRPLFLFKKL